MPSKVSLIARLAIVSALVAASSCADKPHLAIQYPPAADVKVEPEPVAPEFPSIGIDINLDEPAPFSGDMLEMEIGVSEGGPTGVDHSNLLDFDLPEDATLALPPRKPRP